MVAAYQAGMSAPCVPQTLERLAPDKTSASALAGGIYVALSFPEPDAVADALEFAGWAPDGDSVAAVAGAFLGAVHGYEALPVAHHHEARARMGHGPARPRPRPPSGREPSRRRVEVRGPRGPTTSGPVVGHPIPRRLRVAITPSCLQDLADPSADALTPASVAKCSPPSAARIGAGMSWGPDTVCRRTVEGQPNG